MRRGARAMMAVGGLAAAWGFGAWAVAVESSTRNVGFIAGVLGNALAVAGAARLRDLSKADDAEPPAPSGFRPLTWVLLAILAGLIGLIVYAELTL